MRVIFMGTPEFAVPPLRTLIAENFDICAVYTQPPRPAGRGQKLTPSPVHQLAAAEGIPVFTPTSLNDAAEQQCFANHKADIAVVAAYGMLLPPAILAGTRLGCINVHPSDLPRWRGAAPIQRTLMAGDSTTACCIMRMEEGLDTGAVYARRHYAITEGMNAGALHDVMAQMGADMLPEVMRSLANSTARATPQIEAGITYAKKITKEDCIIDCTRPAFDILNQIRGLAPAPCASLTIGGEAVKIISADIVPAPAGSHAGDVFLSHGLQITCVDGHALRVMTLKRPGKQAQSAIDALRGWALPEGNIFS